VLVAEHTPFCRNRFQKRCLGVTVAVRGCVDRRKVVKRAKRVGMVVAQCAASTFVHLHRERLGFGVSAALIGESLQIVQRRQGVEVRVSEHASLLCERVPAKPLVVVPTLLQQEQAREIEVDPKRFRMVLAERTRAPFHYLAVQRLCQVVPPLVQPGRGDK